MRSVIGPINPQMVQHNRERPTLFRPNSTQSLTSHLGGPVEYPSLIAIPLSYCGLPVSLVIATPIELA